MRAPLPLLALLLAAPAGAAPAGGSSAAPVAVLSSDSAHYRQALEGFAEAWGSTVTVVSADERPSAQASAFVAIGSKAAARRWPRDAVVVACLAPSVGAGRGGALSSVSLLPEPAVLVSRLRALAPKLRVLRVFWSSEASRDDVEALAAAGEGQGLVVLSERIDPPSLLPERLRGLDGPTDGLWLMPDPALVNEQSFATVREYAAARKIPFFGPTEGLAERGASATVAVTFHEMGRAAARALRARLEGRSESETVHAGRVTVTVNAAAARAAGLGPRFESADKVLP
ncbi:MAG: hypothetical protein HYV14_14530 [Elusimicrobia bacterium]|nr:hypothetical protein [Elusimicrobiota bacterium]